ncbi:MAG: histidine--tRNA ligase [Spirochaetaceae bacterium]|jgi:histidyl-tRNA synthetase|nr:histidine--tRNA ligase [Spirochaetaceae bacterium]
MAVLIEPKILKGFRDFLPAAEIARRTLVEKIETDFRLYGFVPIDTPALEYTEILLGKGGGETEKQVYRFRDHGDRDVALRYDLTVPFARFVAQYRGELVFPFKRYHIAKVWRGENSQRGRYREFTQCDFDIVGSDSAAADFEIMLMMRNILRDIGAGEARIRINHRGLFNRFLEKTGVRSASAAILRAVDKLAKIGETETRRLLADIAGTEGAEAILTYISAGGTYEETLSRLAALSGGESPETERLRLLWRNITDAGAADSFMLDPSITRGLDYYTGIVYETFLADDPAIGSVCSGGRYDNLAGLYSKDRISGVGASIGLDRLIAALESRGRLAEQKTWARLAVACVREEDAGVCQTLAERFRRAGICCEVLLETGAAAGKTGEADKDAEKKLTRQFIQAEKKGAAWVIIPASGAAAGETARNLALRDLASRRTTDGLGVEDIIKMTGQLPD